MNASPYAPAGATFLSAYMSQRLGVQLQELELPELPAGLGEAQAAPAALEEGDLAA